MVDNGKNLGFKDYVGGGFEQLDNGENWVFRTYSFHAVARVYPWPPHTVTQHQSSLHSYGEWSENFPENFR